MEIPTNAVREQLHIGFDAANGEDYGALTLRRGDKVLTLVGEDAELVQLYAEHTSHSQAREAEQSAYARFRDKLMGTTFTDSWNLPAVYVMNIDTIYNELVGGKE